MITKLVPAKVAAVAMGALLSTGAAAAGALPDTVQSVVSDALGTVGLRVPDGSGPGPSLLDVDDTTTTTLGDSTTTTLDDSTTTTLDTTTTTLGGGDDDGSDGAGIAPCTSAANHGEFVSGVARSTPSGPGKGAVVSDAAHSDCGRHGGGGDGGGDLDDDGDAGTAGSAGSDRGPGKGNGNGGSANTGPGNGGGSGNSGSGGRSGRG